MNVLPIELNRRLSDWIRKRISADQSVTAGHVYFFRLTGLGLVTFGLGVATGIGLYGYSFVTRNTENINVLTSALSNALAAVQLHATADGTVQIEPREIAIADGQTVRLASDAHVLIDPKSRVLADGEIRVQPPTISAPLPTSQRPIAAIMTDFTVFKRVPFEKGNVMTGWMFLTSAQREPTEQYCYYTEDAQAPGVSVTLTLGTNQQFETAKNPPKDFDVAAAFSRCVWFRS
jgi:hypothetical protein